MKPNRSYSLLDFFEPKKPAAEVVPASKVTLRPYQGEAVESVFQQWNENAATLVCLPTGCGKSVVFSEVIRRVCSN